MVCMNWIAWCLAHPTTCPSATLNPFLAQLALEFTSDPGMGTEMERTTQPMCYQTISESLPSVYQSLIRAPYPQIPRPGVCLIWARTFRYPVDVTSVTSQQTGFHQLWRRPLAVLGSGPGPGFCPPLRSSTADEGLKACGPTGSSFPLCSEASLLL